MCTLLAVPAVAACLAMAPDPTDPVKGEGAVVRIPLTVDAFHGIQVESCVDVVVTPAKAQTVEVEAQPNIAEIVTTDVKDGVLVISTRSDYSAYHPVIVHIGVPLIDIVRVNDIGDVKVEGSFHAGDVELSVRNAGDIVFACSATNVHADLAGAGDITLTGDCRTLKSTLQGTGDLLAADLKATDVDVLSQGSGDARVNASESLKVSASGSGDVVYSGKPKHVNRNAAGSGAVRPSGPRGPL